MGLASHLPRMLDRVLPVQKGMVIFGMKSMGGSGEAVVHGALTPTEALSHAMRVAGVSTTISGMDSMEVLDQNLQILRGFKPLDEKQMESLRQQGRQFNGVRYELFKSTVKYDGELGRQQHNFPSTEGLPAQTRSAIEMTGKSKEIQDGWRKEV
jgi:uncharacterized protein